jgi:hypothetical protein
LEGLKFLRFACNTVVVKTKAANANSMSKQDTRYLGLIDDYLQRIKEVRKEMRRSKVEIERLKSSSRRKLAEIDAILSRV